MSKFSVLAGMLIKIQILLLYVLMVKTMLQICVDLILYCLIL